MREFILESDTRSRQLRELSVVEGRSLRQPLRGLTDCSGAA